MTFLDYLIIAVFFLSIILFSLYQKRKSDNTNQSYFLAGKNIHWIVAMLSIVATETSVLTFVGIPAMSYASKNWNFLQVVVGYIFGRVLVAYIFCLEILMLVTVSALILFYHFFYFLALMKEDYSVVDIAWSLSFSVIFYMSVFAHSTDFSLRLGVLLVIVTLWSLRLGGYLLARNLKLKEEDFRYTEMRKNWGKNSNLHAYFKCKQEEK